MNIKGRFTVLIASVVLQLCLGIYYIWNIFLIPVMNLYGWTSLQTSMTFYILIAFNTVGFIVGGKINYKKGPRLTLLLGWGFFVSGLLLSSVVPVNCPWLLYITYGVITGFGIGAGYITIISCTQSWWPHRKGLAAGITVGAYGASTLVLVPIVNYIISEKVLGVSLTFRTLAICFSLIFFIVIWFIKNPSAGYAENMLTNDNNFSVQKQYSLREVVKTKEFYKILLCFFFLPPAYYLLNPIFKSLGQLRGLSEAAALGNVMVSGVASVFGRLSAPSLADKVGVRKVIYLLYIIMFISTLSLVFAQGFLFIIFIFLVAYAYGGWAGIIPVTVSDYFGTKHLTSNYGIVMISPSLSGLVFPMAANLLSVQGIPNVLTFMVPITGCIIGFIISLSLKNPAVKSEITSKFIGTDSC